MVYISFGGKKYTFYFFIFIKQAVLDSKSIFECNNLHLITYGFI